jgi:hypothetical protein
MLPWNIINYLNRFKKSIALTFRCVNILILIKLSE